MSIYMPEVNLTQQQALSKDELSNKVGLSRGSSDSNKPLLMQVLENFLSNEKSGGQSNIHIEATKKPEVDYKAQSV